MNSAFLSVQALEDPAKVFTSATRTTVKMLVKVPGFGKKSDTILPLSIWRQEDQQRIMQSIKKDAHLFVAGARLRHDSVTKEWSLDGGNVYAIRPSEFGIVNEVILAGRCIVDMDKADPKVFKATESGYLIANQCLAVGVGRQQSELFPFYGINKADDSYNLAMHIGDFTRKGTGVTISGRLATDTWIDKATGQQKSGTKIQLTKMTLGPKPKTTEIKPRTTIASGSEPASLWGTPPDPADESPDEAPTPEPVNSDRPSEPQTVPEAAPQPVGVSNNSDVWADKMPDLPPSGDDDQPF